ncbi:MAG: deoxyribose-phosphate aldolase [Ignavibacteriaceae bacterium]|nr:deoxyribose-phosphate aldolase [Ignavibacterium sp.]MCC6256430.1 deoxyribose-phosphate aldolase [Ignavibacteriaceae bacterium]HRN26478.1 deoxyribose-phosphate aldolase [Ignavibacteriaceae bacterium]HRP92065.1 deoxyribose-phosphate aldolase [Ignavibacteriaceae bacterium]HRQ53905.1 deoxyribose-phosphate aldolase [Ignavibacteriaceae bacterium]
MLPNLNNLPVYDTVGVDERIARFGTRSIKTSSKKEGLNLAISMIDLTTLEGNDTRGKVQQLCYKAMHPNDLYSDIPKVAAVCVYPSFVGIAKKALEGSGIRVASVATAFPSGQSALEVKLKDVKTAVDQGADEIDMVISRGKFLSGDYLYVFDEIAAIKKACGDAHLKVILETGELETLDNVRKASEIAIYAGADFIKTSTGKVQPAATMQVTYVMLDAIKDYYLKTGKMIGMKPAGGISNAKLALQYLVMLNEVLGEKWMNKNYFRFGASSLLNDLLMQLIKLKTGVYQSSNYFSKD